MPKQADLDAFRIPFVGGNGAANGARKARKLDLSAYDTAARPASTGSKEGDRARLSEIGARLDELQERLHAQRRQRVLLVLQGMDTSGKDGTIRAVFHDVDPLGLRIVPFKAPAEIELAHDFLWRVHAQAPAAGELTIFNRSHYEDVLVPRVREQIDDDEVERRYRHILDFEKLLVDSGATILKCFLHISKETQRERLQARIDDPKKHWKFDLTDIDARKLWDKYQLAYANALAATSVDYAPWYVIPADSKTHRNLMVAEVLLRTLEALKLTYPPPKESLKGVVIE